MAIPKVKYYRYFIDFKTYLQNWVKVEMVLLKGC